MENLSYEFVIVGSGIAGSLMAERLSKKGIKILILEAGDIVDRGKIFNRCKVFNRYMNTAQKIPESLYEEQAHARIPTTINESYFIQRGKDFFKSTYLRNSDSSGKIVT